MPENAFQGLMPRVNAHEDAEMKEGWLCRGALGLSCSSSLCFSQSLLPEVVVLVGVSGQSVWLQLLRICRVLRSLKLIARFRQIRVIILAVVRALKVM